MSKTIEISSYDEDTFLAIREKFATNIKESSWGDAESALERNVNICEAFRMCAAHWRCKYYESTNSYAKHVRAMASFLDASIAPLQRAFGKNSVMRALPEEAKNDRVIKLCEQLGQRNMVNLCQEAIAMTSQ